MTFFLRVTMRPGGIIALRALPQSKMRAALRYVPPTTLIGAIAYPLLNIRGNRGETLYEGKTFKSSASSVLGLFHWVTVKTSGRPKLYGSLLRINTIYRGKAQNAVTSLPLAVMYGENDPTITAIYLIDEKALEESVYSLKDIKRAAWGITRLGSRESIVSVEDVQTGRTDVIKAEVADTSYAFPFKVLEVNGRGTLQLVVDWRYGIGDYSKAKRIAMFYPEGSVRVKGQLKIAEIDGEVIVLAS